MIKVISLLKRADNLSKQDFAAWVIEDHVKFARMLPGLRKYSVSVAEGDDAAFDSVNELYFDDEAARARAFGSELGQAAAADAASHTRERVHLITVEHEQL